MRFHDRIDAGTRLGQALLGLRTARPVVLGLPRGGVPVAAQVARALDAPLDVIVVRKLGLPSQPEVAMGAVGEGGVLVVNDAVVRGAAVPDSALAAVERRERFELERRTSRFRGGRPPLALAGRTAVVVDDGIATGSTARAACLVARAMGAVRVVLAVPVAAPDAVDRLRAVADEVVCLDAPEGFYAVGQFYDDFHPTTDDDVEELLRRPVPSPRSPAPEDRDVEVPAGPVGLGGRLTVPDGAGGLVVFAHGSGSSRFSARNLTVAGALNRAGLGTLLFDLLTEDEELDRGNVFDIGLLGARLLAATHWVRAQPGLQGLPVGFFGASTGAAAALWAASAPGSDCAAVVSRGGRPDLAHGRLAKVRAPTLLIVGGRDEVVLELNRKAAAELSCPHELVVVPGATHLFEEAGALRSVAELAGGWFTRHLAAVAAAHR